MAKEKISFEQFFESVEAGNKPFVQDLHSYLLENGCKVTFEEKKNGYLASYKYGKPPKAVANFVFRKEGMITRIYGERISAYPDFLNTLPKEMVQHIEGAGVCKRIVDNTCGLKCNGYDFMIGDSHFQKCRYNCFEFLMTDESKPYIKTFAEHEIKERMA
ncbi:MAG: hypothetical protein FWC91_14760 [Defluviitaleaceae bacterium]|nr:hypothetical protein [Defluviitaleaceae bacterium]